MNNLEKQFLLKKIKSGKIKSEELESFIEFFKKEDNQIKFELYRSIRKYDHLLNIPLLSKKLNLSEETIFKIFNSEYKISYFPVVIPSKNEAKLAKLLVIQLDNINKPILISSDKSIKNSINTIKKLVKKNFFVLFSENFIHTSFMLSLYAALKYPQHILDKYAFTGIIGNDGNIYEVEAIEEKRKIAIKEGKKLISPLETRDIKELDFWMNKPYIPIPFVQLANKDINKALEDLEYRIKEKERYFSLKNLKSIYEIDKSMISLNYNGFLPFNEKFWTDYINIEFETKIKSIINKLKNKTAIFHISASISALAFGLGVKFGSRFPCVIYHFQKGKENSYFPVLRLDDTNTLRKIKEIKHDILRRTKYTTLNILNEKPNFSEVAISLYLASHYLSSDVKKFLKSIGKDIPIIEISLKDKQGNIPIDIDWSEYIIEINSIINKLKATKDITKINLFISTPVPIAFALGMVIGHVINIPVYAYNSKGKNLNNKYIKVFETANIPSPF